MSLAEVDTSFMDKAPCKGCPPEWFFGHNNTLTRKGKAVCATCPFTEPCLEAGLKFTQIQQLGGSRETRAKKALLFGIWGGKSEADLRKEKRKQNATVG